MSDKKDDKKNILVSSNKGHRERLRDEFLKYPESFSDVKLLELMLFFVIPRRDTKLIAKTLLYKYGNLLNVLVSIHQTDNIPYLNDRSKSLLHLMYCISKRILEYQLIYDEEFSIDNIIRYYRLILQWKHTEELHIVLLNNNMKIIHRELLSIGTIDNVSIDPRKILQKILHYSATKIVLIHNHPNGTITPSIMDMEFTQKIKKILMTINVEVFDHIIIGHGEFFSFKDNSIIL